MTFETLRCDIDSRGVATITLDQPEKHNAMSTLTISELTSAAGALGQDNNVRVVVLTGAGRSFCAGGDLEWMRLQFEADREARVEEAMKLAGMLRALNELPKPLIGRIQGQAYGGGVGLICICDVAIADNSAMFGLTETRLGLIPATIGPYVVARIGEGYARRIFYSGRRFDAAEAIKLGLLSDAVSAEDLDDRIEKEVVPYLSTAPEAVGMAKALARKLGPDIDEEIMRHTAEKLADCWESSEAMEGVSAFFEKRNPPWVSK